MKFQDLKTSESSLKKLLNADLPIQTSLTLRRLVKSVDTELKFFEDERIKLVTKFGTKDTEGNLNVEKDNLEAFTLELNTLLESDCDVPTHTVDLSKIEDVKLSAVDIYLLEPFLIEEKQQTLRAVR